MAPIRARIGRDQAHLFLQHEGVVGRGLATVVVFPTPVGPTRAWKQGGESSSHGSTVWMRGGQALHQHVPPVGRRGRLPVAHAGRGLAYLLEDGLYVRRGEPDIDQPFTQPLRDTEGRRRAGRRLLRRRRPGFP